MAAATAPRKTISIYDYPEHLNPFHEEDNHNKIRFWTLGRKLNRSNSITFSGIKDIKNSWAFRSFMKKGKKGQQTSSQENKTTNQSNGETSPIVYRRAMQYSSSSQAMNGRSTVSSPERYVYGGSVTPLPRSRFQERLRSPSQFEVNSHTATPRMARSEVSGSRLSVESSNPFEDDPVPPVRAARKKKKRAPPPPPTIITQAKDVNESETPDVSITLSNPDLKIVEGDDFKQPNADDEIEDVNLNIELRIVEDEDIYNKDKERSEDINQKSEPITIVDNKNSIHSETPKHRNGNVVKENEEPNNIIRNAVSNDDILDNEDTFSKVDIVKYRRNSSLNEDDIRLRRGNLEDFNLANKRSKSLTIAITQPYMVCDLNLNENKLDGNGNEEPLKVTCKIYDEVGHKQSTDTISSTEREFIEIDRATRELEKEISKLNSALIQDEDILMGNRLSVSDIKRRFDKNDSSPNPIPKPRRSHYGGSSSPVAEHVQT